LAGDGVARPIVTYKSWRQDRGWLRVQKLPPRPSSQQRPEAHPLLQQRGVLRANVAVIGRGSEDTALAKKLGAHVERQGAIPCRFNDAKLIPGILEAVVEEANRSPHAAWPFFVIVLQGRGLDSAPIWPPPRKRRLSPKARRALDLLANRLSGVTERLLLARGFSRRMLLGLVKQGLATLTYERVLALGKIIEVGKMQIRLQGEGRSKRDRRNPSPLATQ
jgi:hypothetical protein